MTDRNSDRKYAWYICGQCGYEVYHLKSEPRPNPCPECGWEHETKNKYNIPSEVKLDLANPNG